MFVPLHFILIPLLIIKKKKTGVATICKQIIQYYTQL